MTPWPGANVHDGVSPSSAAPPAVFGVATNLITSPVRRSAVDGVIVSDEMVLATTSIAIVPAAAPAVAVIVARPGARAVSSPLSATRTIDGDELFHTIRSPRRSPAAE